MSLCAVRERTTEAAYRRELLRRHGWTKEVDPWRDADELDIRREMERRLIARGWLPQERQVG